MYLQNSKNNRHLSSTGQTDFFKVIIINLICQKESSSENGHDRKNGKMKIELHCNAAACDVNDRY